MKTKLMLSALIGASLFAVPVAAHHSAAAYDRTNFITITGEVTEYHWLNPHTWVYLSVTAEDGTTQQWALEGESVGQYVNMGWTQDQLAVGDVVEAHVWRLKDGSFGGQLGYLVRQDGKILGEVPHQE